MGVKKGFARHQTVEKNVEKNAIIRLKRKEGETKQKNKLIVAFSLCASV